MTHNISAIGGVFGVSFHISQKKNLGQYLRKGANGTVCIFCGQSTPKILVGMPILTDDCNFV